MKTQSIILLLILLVFISCVKEEFQKTVTFKLDTKGIENVKSIGISGNFLPTKWNETVPLTEANNDGIYEISFSQKTSVSSINFKFVKNDNEYELLDLPNREIKFEYQPETIIYKANFDNPAFEIIKK